MISLPRHPSPAFVVAVLALLLATGSTSYAAGLARNSVGTEQLKAGAVTAAKIKDGAVGGTEVRDGSLTGGDLTDGSVGLADLAPAAAPASDRSIVTYVGETNGRVELMRTPDFVLSIECYVEANTAYLYINAPDPAGYLVTIGTETRSDKFGIRTEPIVQASVQLYAQAPQGAAGTSVYAGSIRYGDRPWVRLTVSVRAEDFTGTGGPQGCPVQLVATPGR